MNNLHFQIPLLESPAVSMLVAAPQHLFGTWCAALTVSLQHPASPNSKVEGSESQDKHADSATSVMPEVWSNGTGYFA